MSSQPQKSFGRFGQSKGRPCGSSLAMPPSLDTVPSMYCKGMPFPSSPTELITLHELPNSCDGSTPDVSGRKEPTHRRRQSESRGKAQATSREKKVECLPPLELQWHKLSIKWGDSSWSLSAPARLPCIIRPSLTFWLPNYQQSTEQSGTTPLPLHLLVLKLPFLPYHRSLLHCYNQLL